VRSLMRTLPCLFAGVVLGAGAALAVEPVETPRPIPLTRPEMKALLEDMKTRKLRIPLPELTEEQKQELGERANNYESRLRAAYLPPGEGSVFGGGGRPAGNNAAGGAPGAAPPQRDFTRNADEKMSLTYPFKTKLFWIVSRTNNCQYCLGHQEQKLAAAGLSEEEIASLDSNWARFSPAEQAALAWARKLTYEPHLLSDSDIAELKQHYTEMQILEMTMSVAGNNAINRWKEGAGIPQSQSGSNFFRRVPESAPANRPLPIESFLTPTPAEFEKARSAVATYELDEQTGRPVAVSTRPKLESRGEVLAALTAAKSRTPRLPVPTEDDARRDLGENAPAGKLPLWMRLVANFPNESRGRIRAINAIESTQGDLSPVLKAQVSWIIARQDRAWYATGVVMQRLKELGQTEDQIFALDGDWAQFSPAERAMFQFARHLAATPIALTDADVAEALERTSPRQVVQLVNFVTSRAYFDRVTEAAGLPLE
ncbi:MAG TPA: carboxymuconolactone decarboxylase family protein, partial [Planctomycetaceae bacterium]|nr:carboxymuconolactone decarboxylase family protein [Planctomycetaceae bacterium]